MRDIDLEEHMRLPMENQAFESMGWHCKECQITLFNWIQMCSGGMGR